MASNDRHTEDATGAGLRDFVARTARPGTLRVEEDLGDGYVRLRVAEAERRQARDDIRCVEDAVIELLRNARDAGARHILVATSREGSLRTVVVVDDGCGIPRDLWDRVFEARVTSKLSSAHMDSWGIHGRGMALYSIRQNASDARVVCSEQGLGTAMVVTFDTERIPEKADQSTWPTLTRPSAADADDSDGESVASRLRGPHNILRTCAEFSLDAREGQQSGCTVYVGSPAEVCAAARSRLRFSADERVRMLHDDLESFRLPLRLRVAGDAPELAACATQMGLPLSERTAQRILAGQVHEAPEAGEKVLGVRRKNPAARRPCVDLTRDRRGLHLSQEDREEFCHMMDRDFGYLAQRYYLTPQGSAELRVSDGKLTVSFAYRTED